MARSSQRASTKFHRVELRDPKDMEDMFPQLLQLECLSLHFSNLFGAQQQQFGLLATLDITATCAQARQEGGLVTSGYSWTHGECQIAALGTRQMS